MKNQQVIAAGEFKAKCLQLMDEVHDHHSHLIITKHGKPVAMLVPIDEEPVNFFGCMKNTVVINADITTPIDVEWEADK